MRNERTLQELTLLVPDELLDAVADRVAARVRERLPEPAPDSPWLDFDGALAYLGFTRDQLYKLTAARAIPFRKKHRGQGLLFHREELDRWLEREYPATGCAAQVELWSTTDRNERRPGGAPTPRGRQRR